jgi:hypothetical protein
MLALKEALRSENSNQMPQWSGHMNAFKEAFNGVFLVRLAAGLICAGVSAYGVTLYTLNYTQAGFVTALEAIQNQQLAQQNQIPSGDQNVRSDLGSSIDEASKRFEAAMDRITIKIDSMGAQVGKTTEQFAVLNSSVTSLNQKLDDSINRQINFERLVLAKLLNEKPAEFSASPETMDLWIKAGLNQDTYQLVAFPSNESAVEGWAKFSTTAPIKE